MLSLMKRVEITVHGNEIYRSKAKSFEGMGSQSVQVNRGRRVLKEYFAGIMQSFTSMLLNIV